MSSRRGPREEVLDDFTGGLQERSLEAADFTQRSWAELYGMLLRDGRGVDVQPPLQRIGTGLRDAAFVAGYAGSETFYLISVGTDDILRWTELPERLASYSTANGAHWQTVGIEEPGLRLVGEGMWLPTDYGYRAGQIWGSADTDRMFVIFESNNGGLAHVTFEGDDLFPSFSESEPEGDEEPVRTVDAGKMPRGKVACVWGDSLVVAGGDWKSREDEPFGPDNATTHGNVMWISEPGRHDAFDPQAVAFPCSPNAEIVGLQPVDEGLLVFTTAVSDGDGIILLRGGPSNPEKVVVRGGLGAPVSTWEPERFDVMWERTGAAVFVANDGAVWQTDGVTVERLDAYGPEEPSWSSPSTHVAALGDYLFLSRGHRLLALRAFAEDGAWSEIHVPWVTNPRSMSAVDADLVFVADGYVWRLALAGRDDERGMVDGQPFTWRVSTATLSTHPHERSMWHRFGVAQAGGRLLRVGLRAGAALDSDAPVLWHDVDEELGGRGRWMVRGFGASREASVTVEGEGGERLESVTVWHSGRRLLR